jgi:hypothetical protein
MLFPLAPPPRPKPEIVGDEVEAPPHPGKSIVVAMGGALSASFVVDAVLLEGSGVAQASLEPHGSALERLANAFTWDVVEFAGFGGPWELGAGLDKLKADLMGEESAGAVLGAAACGAGSAKSNKLKLEAGVTFGC